MSLGLMQLVCDVNISQEAMSLWDMLMYVA